MGWASRHWCQLNVKAQPDKKSENFSIYHLDFRSPLTHASRGELMQSSPYSPFLTGRLAANGHPTAGAGSLFKGELESNTPFLRGLGDLKGQVIECLSLS